MPAKRWDAESVALLLRSAGASMVAPGPMTQARGAHPTRDARLSLKFRSLDVIAAKLNEIAPLGAGMIAKPVSAMTDDELVAELTPAKTQRERIEEATRLAARSSQT